MVKKKKEDEACSIDCYPCKLCNWLLPLVIIALVWFGPTTIWSKVVITIAAALLVLGNICPCKK